jgi:hypothetical protein
VASRLAAPALALVVVLASVAGAGGLASLVLLTVIVAAAVRLLVAVGDAAEGRTSRVPAAAAAAGLVWVVAAGAAHLPLLVVGLLVCAGIELLAGSSGRPDAAAEPLELAPASLSRAA